MKLVRAAHTNRNIGEGIQTQKKWILTSLGGDSILLVSKGNEVYTIWAQYRLVLSSNRTDFVSALQNFYVCLIDFGFSTGRTINVASNYGKLPQRDAMILNPVVIFQILSS